LLVKEIARRLGKLCNAPFIKVEATKFTEVGFHGRDVDQIIRDLLNIGISETKKLMQENRKGQVTHSVEERLLTGLLGEVPERVKNSFRPMLRRGLLDDVKLNVYVPDAAPTDQEQPNFIALDRNSIQKLFKQVTQDSENTSGSYVSIYCHSIILSFYFVKWHSLFDDLFRNLLRFEKLDYSC
jgi:ATP-dependent protease HslVU (ClpYQ) ATPase subunit